MTEANNNQENIIKDAVRQFVDARLKGEHPEIDEFVKDYPGLEHQIREGIKNLQKIDALFDTLVQPGEWDFENTSNAPDLVGQKIGSFEITEVIGSGGMGVVYLAHDTKLKRSVAIKTMPATLAGDSITRMRFKREAELLASLNHPNIAVIYEIIEEKKSGYLILEYIPGETLAQRIAREPLKLEEALSLAQQIAEAVSAAHEKGIIHRDLKPGNIKITPEGKVKVLDFGLAKTSVSEGENIENTVTEAGRIIGTPAYMSPEQARGKAIDHRTDIWSFGCIVYQMLTNQVPFDGDTATEIIARIIERQPDWQLLPESTPINIRVLLRRCLEKDPRRRLGNIADAAVEIDDTMSKSVTAQVVTKSAKLRKVAMMIGLVAMGIILSVIALKFFQKKEILPSPKEIRLVVLPFENLGPDEDEYFADGITDAITARLAGIHGLGVISRQSAIQYKGSEKDTRQIAEELDVDYILEGTVQRERPSDPTSRVRIIPQLIKASEDTHVWTEIYDDDMSKVFRLQSDVAEQVAHALDITVLQAERRALSSIPTKNIEAYEYYLRGNEYVVRSENENDFEIAIRMYEKSIELDPVFAAAYARLSDVHSQMYWYHYDHSNERLTMAKENVDRAFQLHPELPEAHISLGHYYYQGHLDYDRALEQFAIARKSQPNNSQILAWIGYVQRRQGKFRQALANIKRACELDPRSGKLAEEAGITFMILRRYPEAERYLNRAILLAPDLQESYTKKKLLYLCWEGNTQKARSVLVEALHNNRSEENSDLVNSLIELDVFEGNYQEALDRLSSQPEDIEIRGNFVPVALRYALIYMYMDEKDQAKEYYDEARSTLESKIKEMPEDARFHSSLGIAYAGLGRKKAAIREGKLGVELLPVTKDALKGSGRLKDLARIYVMVGEFDAAIDQLEHLLSKTGQFSTHLLRLDPAWDPLRNHPRFKKLLESDK